VIFKFIPKECNFFDLFEKQVNFAVEAATYFKEVTQKGVVDEAAIKKIKDIEHQSDEATHAIFEQLNKTFITPFDREDIHALAGQIDDVVDMFNTIASRLHIYKITRIDKNMIEFATVIEESVRAVAATVKGMRNIKNSKLILP
jgi:uncharacterized protein Yka (UPF0111/DUF47 family)